MKNVNRDEYMVPIEEVTTFYTIAYTAFLKAERLVEERTDYERKVDKEDREWTKDDIIYLERNHLTPADEQRLAIVTVIFSALALEALINDYAIFNFSMSYLENYLDTLSPRSKWLIFPWLVKGKAISTDGQTFQDLTELFRLRNEWVHFKRLRRPADGPGEKDRITKENAFRAIEVVRKVVAELKRLDGRISTLWLADTETSRLE